MGVTLSLELVPRDFQHPKLHGQNCQHSTFQKKKWSKRINHLYQMLQWKELKSAH